MSEAEKSGQVPDLDAAPAAEDPAAGLGVGRTPQKVREDARALARLIRHARDKARDNRRVLSENVVELGLDPTDRLSERELTLINGILRSLVQDFEMPIRRELSDRFGTMKSTPEQLARALANPGVEIAGPLLLRRHVLNRPDLVEAVKIRAQEHILGEAIRGALMGGGTGAPDEDDLPELLMRQDDPVLARRAREYVVEQARRVDRFQQPRMIGSDLPTGLARRVCWAVAAALRHFMLEMSAETGAPAEPVIDDVVEDSARTVIAGPDGWAPAQEAAGVLVARLAGTGRLAPGLAIRALEGGHIPLFVAVLGGLCRLDGFTTRRLIFEDSGIGLTLAFRAAGVARDDLGSVLSLTSRIGGANRRRVGSVRLLTLYDSTPRAHARHALGYWQRNEDYLSAVEQMNK